MAARRRPYGSAAPVAFSPTPMIPTSWWSRSARPTSAPEVAARHLLRGAQGLVVVLDGVGDLCPEPFQPRVVSAHGALQLGKLAHHPGGEVGLAEPRGLEDVGDQLLPAERAGQPARHRADAVDAIELAAQPRLVGPAPQVLDAVAELALAILLEEEAGVGEARAQHPLVAVPGHGAILAPPCRRPR